MFRIQNLCRCYILSLQQKTYAVSSHGFKSKYSLDNIYPLSDTDISKPPLRPANDQEHEIFNGYIPVDELDIRYSKGSGPGGQSVNKANSKVEVRFHVDTAQWIPPWIRPKLLEQERTRITKEGYLIVNSEKTRKQILNQADCLDKIRHYIYKCSVIPKEPSQEDIALKARRIAKAQQAILREKREKSLKKFYRQPHSATPL